MHPPPGYSWHIERLRVRLSGHAWSILCLTAMLCLLAILAFVPAPSSIVADGRLTLPAGARLLADSDGEVEATLVRHGQKVQPGQALMRLRDARGQAARLVRASVSGEFVEADHDDMDQRHVRRGQLLGYVLPNSHSLVRAELSWRDWQVLTGRFKAASVMLAERPGLALAAVVLDQDRLVTPKPRMPGLGPSMQASTVGPTRSLELVLSERIPRAGGRVRVKLDLTPQPLLQTWLQRWRLRHAAPQPGQTPTV